MADGPSSPPRPTPQQREAPVLQQRSTPQLSIPTPEQQRHTRLSEPRPPVTTTGPTSNLVQSSSSSPAPAATAAATTAASAPPVPVLSQWQQQQLPSQPRRSDATLDINHQITSTHSAASSSSWSPISITATHPYAPNIRLSPQVEEDIKAAVLEAALAQQHANDRKNKRKNAYGGSGSGSGDKKKTGKRKKSVRRAPDGRRESPQTTRNWLIAKKVLRWVSLTICALMVVGEAVLAILDGAYADTALGICLGFLLGIWDTVRLVRLRLKRDKEPVSIFHLLIEGTFTVAIIVAVACIIDQVRRFWAGEFLIRGWVFSAGMLVQEGVHITLFARACVDKYLHRDAIDFRRYHGWELPWYADPQPTEIVVKYVHVCPRCDSEFSPGDYDVEKGAVRKRAKKGEEEKEKKRRQQQGIPSVVVTE